MTFAWLMALRIEDVGVGCRINFFDKTPRQQEHGCDDEKLNKSKAFMMLCVLSIAAGAGASVSECDRRRGLAT